LKKQNLKKIWEMHKKVSWGGVICPGVWFKKGEMLGGGGKQRQKMNACWNPLEKKTEQKGKKTPISTPTKK